jgi:hypothetical protein|tara:strand:+ start:46 stop:234 length:189 start_codon:yes stop_codon:yes gene_type:complete
MSDLKRYRVKVALIKTVIVYAPSSDGVSDTANCMVLDALDELDLRDNLLEDITLEVGEPNEE